MLEIDWLCEKIVGAPVHGDAQVLHVSVRGDNHGAQDAIHIGEARKQSQPIHHRHVDIAHHDIDSAVRRQLIQRLLAVQREGEFELAVADLAAEALPDEQLHIRFVVNYQNLESHYVLGSVMMNSAYSPGRESTRSWPLCSCTTIS